MPKNKNKASPNNKNNHKDTSSSGSSENKSTSPIENQAKLTQKVSKSCFSGNDSDNLKQKPTQKPVILSQNSNEFEYSGPVYQNSYTNLRDS